MLLAANASGQVPSDLSAFMPSKAEMRKSLVDSGMSAAQIEQILNSMDFPEEIESNETASSETESKCVDVNENEVCDADEDDPDVRQCIAIYQNELYATSSSLYGNSLGRNAVEVAQTCSTAAAGGTQVFSTDSNGGFWRYDIDQLIDIGSYWTQILSHGRYLGDHDMPEMDELSDAQLQSIMAGFPHDLQTMMRSAGSSDFRTIAEPIHRKCEHIRSRVGNNYRKNSLVKNVCTRHVPDADAAGLVIKDLDK